MSTEVLHDWLAWYAASDPSPQTLRLRRYQLTRFAQQHPDLLAVTDADLARWLGRPGWSTETRRSQLAALRSLYGVGARVGPDRARPVEAVASDQAGAASGPAGAGSRGEAGHAGSGQAGGS